MLEGAGRRVYVLIFAGSRWDVQIIVFTSRRRAGPALRLRSQPQRARSETERNFEIKVGIGRRRAPRGESARAAEVRCRVEQDLAFLPVGRRPEGGDFLAALFPESAAYSPG